MKNDVSHVDKLLKLIFPDNRKNRMPDQENPKSRKSFLGSKRIFPENVSQSSNGVLGSFKGVMFMRQE